MPSTKETNLLASGQVLNTPVDYGSRDVKLTEGSIALYVMGRGNPIVVEVGDGITLGRIVPDSEAPTVDLTEFHARLLGVSRQHVRIRRVVGGYTLEDMGSANGTHVNKKRLEAHAPCLLHNSDQIQLGELLLFVYFTAN